MQGFFVDVFNKFVGDFIAFVLIFYNLAKNPCYAFKGKQLYFNSD
jgi:hypothetical protein